MTRTLYIGAALFLAFAVSLLFLGSTIDVQQHGMPTQWDLE